MSECKCEIRIKNILGAPYTDLKKCSLCEAAKDLLEACEEALEVTLKTYDSGLRRDEVNRALIQKLETVIAKARGGESK